MFQIYILQNENFRKKYAKETEEIINILLEQRILTDSQRRVLNQIQKKLSK